RARIHREIDRRQAGQAAAQDVGRGDHASGADARIARRLLVLADREQVAAEHRAVQHDAHQNRHDQEDDEGMRHAERAAGGDPFERWQALAELEARRAVVGVVARRAAIDQQAAQGDDERLQLELRHQEAVDRPKHDTGRDDDDHRKPPRHRVRYQQIDEDHAEQREDRTDRQVDTAGDDDNALAQREQAEQADQVGGVAEVDRRQEARIHEGYDAADHDDQQEQAEVFLHHADTASASWRSRLPTARRITFSSLNSVRARKPATRPSRMTAMRSLTPITSSMSLEIISTATPASLNPRISL